MSAPTITIHYATEWDVRLLSTVGKKYRENFLRRERGWERNTTREVYLITREFRICVSSSESYAPLSRLYFVARRSYIRLVSRADSVRQCSWTDILPICRRRITYRRGINVLDEGAFRFGDFDIPTLPRWRRRGWCLTRFLSQREGFGEESFFFFFFFMEKPGPIQTSGALLIRDKYARAGESGQTGIACTASVNAVSCQLRHRPAMCIYMHVVAHV